MTNSQTTELSIQMSEYIIKLGRAPTATEIEKFIKNFVTALQKGKLFTP